MELLKNIEYLVVHHSQRDIDSLKAIKKRHLARGWEDIGYHFIITKKGIVKKARKLKYIGAHVKGHNKNSIGICLIGNFDKSFPTKNQLISLFKLLNKFSKKYKIKTNNILGHREFPKVTKTCPGKFVNMNLIRAGIKPNS